MKTFSIDTPIGTTNCSNLQHEYESCIVFKTIGLEVVIDGLKVGS
jgi:hypothetical protein